MVRFSRAVERRGFFSRFAWIAVASAVLASVIVPTAAYAAPSAVVMASTQRMSDASLTSTQNGWYSKGASLQLTCFKRGQSVKGYYSPRISGGWDNLWYRVSDGYYVADVDINTGSNDPVTPACTSGPSPVSVDTNSWFTLTARNSGKALDVRGGNASNGAVVQQYAPNRTNSQKWRFVPTDGGYYRIASALNQNEVLDVAGGGSANGAKVQVWAWAGGLNQQWMPYDAGNGVVILKPRYVARCLDVPGGSRTDSVQLQIWDCNGTSSQQYSMANVGPVSSNTSSKIDAFVTNSYGKQLPNVQGTYAGQCVSLVSQYLQQVYGVTTGQWGNAVDYRSGGSGGTRLAAAGFSWSTDQNFRDGDILVWGQSSASGTGPQGHIGIWYHGQIFDQNDARHKPAMSAMYSPFFSGGYLGHWRKAG